MIVASVKKTKNKTRMFGFCFKDLVDNNRLHKMLQSRLLAVRSFATAPQSLQASLLKIEKNMNSKPKLPNEKLIFGKTFTDHMLEIDWEAGSGAIPSVKKISLTLTLIRMDCANYPSSRSSPS